MLFYVMLSVSDMASPWVGLFYLCLLVAVVVTLPIETKTSPNILDVLELCHSNAETNAKHNGYPFPKQYTPDSEVLQGIVNTALDTFDDEVFVQRYVDGKVREIYGDRYTISDLSDYNDSLKNCLQNIMVGLEADSNESLYNNVDMRDFALSEKRDLRAGIKTPRNHVSSALNPTGWRKRRSGSAQDDAYNRRILQNVRELLQKRQQRVQFNPTGW